MKAVRNQKGFSLIELMIVVAIIGILATIAVPNFKKFQAKSRTSEAKSQLSGVYMAEKAFYAEWAQYFADYNAIGFCPEGIMKYNIGFSATGVAAPANYSGTGGIAAGGAAVVFATNAALKAGTCSGFTPDLLQLALGASVPPTAAAFTVQAIGSIDPNFVTAANADSWTLDQNNTMTNVVTGY